MPPKSARRKTGPTTPSKPILGSRSSTPEEDYEVSRTSRSRRRGLLSKAIVESATSEEDSPTPAVATTRKQ